MAQNSVLGDLTGVQIGVDPNAVVGQRDDGNPITRGEMEEYLQNRNKYGKGIDAQEYIRRKDRATVYANKIADFNAKLKAYSEATGTPLTTANMQGISSNIDYNNYDYEDIDKTIGRIDELIGDLGTITPADGGGGDGGSGIADPETIPEMDALIAKINDRIDNPLEVKPEDVTKWTDFYNETYKGQDVKDIARLNEQFSSLGDLGSSANRTALAEMTAGKTQERGLKGLELAFGQNQASNQAIDTGISQLAPLLSQKQQVNLLPWQQKWQEYMTKQGQNYDLMKTNMGINANISAQNQNYKDMMALYEKTKLAEQNWWSPIVNAGLTTAGYAIGGPVGGMVAGGLSSAFGGSKAPTSSSGYRNIGSNSTGAGYSDTPATLNLPRYSTKF